MSQDRPRWLIYAVASGGCAAFNGAFAKLTTTHLTSTWSSAISQLLGLGETNLRMEYAIRIAFFAMNLGMNGVMWGLFTKALTLASSTVRVSVINTSANFVVTALLGAVVFGETLPALWWVGAGLLVSGSVIIGRREDDACVASSGDAAVSKDDDAVQTSAKSKGAITSGRSSTSNEEASRGSARLRNR